MCNKEGVCVCASEKTKVGATIVVSVSLRQKGQSVKAKQKKEKNRKKERKKEKFMWGRVLWVRVCECVRRDRERGRNFLNSQLFFFFSTNFFFFSLSSLFEYSFSNYKPNYILHNGWRRSMFIQQYWERESENGSYWLWIDMIWFDGLIIVFLFPPIIYIYFYMLATKHTENNYAA